VSSSPSPLIDMANDIHAKFKKLVGMLPGAPKVEVDPNQAAHDAEVADLNKKAADDTAKAVADSFAQAQAKMKGEAHDYDSNRPKQPVKSRYSK